MSMQQDAFSLEPGIAYLNHAAVGPWPVRSGEAVQRFVENNLRRGASDYPEWLKVERALRGACARLINAPSFTDISLLKSTSEGLSLVAHGLPWQSGDNVVIFDCEFPSNRIVWESLQRYGVEVRQVALEREGDPEGALLGQCDGRTRLISVSSVQYADGFRIDLERIGSHCRSGNILFCVDAIQSLGALQFDVGRCQADFVVADGHKWMLGPEGLALFYSRAEVRESLALHQYGWHMVADAGDFSARRWVPASDGTRFECGSPNLLAANALNASLGLLLEQGMAEVEAAVLTNHARLRSRLASLEGVEILSAGAPERRSGIVTFRPRRGDPEVLYRYLMAHQVVCAARGGGVRFSPHYYTPPAALDQAVGRVGEWLQAQ